MKMSLIIGGRNITHWGELCRNCAVLVAQNRYSSSANKRFVQRELRKSVVHQYVGLNSEREIRLYGWGLAKTGALGVKTLLLPKVHQKFRPIQFTPLKIDFFPDKKYKIKDASCGYGFSLFVCEDTSGNSILLGTGVNTFSQIGFQAGQKFSTKEFDFICEPGHVFLPLSNLNKTKITHISCGRAHSVVVTDSEGIFTFGNNAFGQCGRKIVKGEIFRNSKVVNHLEFDKKVKQVVCGQDHTLFLTEDGKVYSCGLGVDGQTGLGHHDCTERLTLVEGDIKGENIVQISSKSDTVLAVSDKGDLFGWGNTEYDQLEFVAPNENNVNTPKHLPFKIGKVKVAAAAGSMCAVLNEEGNVFTWGHGILGRGPKVDRGYIPHPLPPTLFGINGFNKSSEIKDIQCGLHHFMVLTKGGNLYSWGKNEGSCLGLGHSKDQYFPWQAQIPAEVMKVCCGVDHTFVVCRSFA